MYIGSSRFVLQFDLCFSLHFRLFIFLFYLRDFLNFFSSSLYRVLNFLLHFCPDFCLLFLFGFNFHSGIEFVCCLFVCFLDFGLLAKFHSEVTALGPDDGTNVSVCGSLLLSWSDFLQKMIPVSCLQGKAPDVILLGLLPGKSSGLSIWYTFSSFLSFPSTVSGVQQSTNHFLYPHQERKKFSHHLLERAGYLPGYRFLCCPQWGRRICCLEFVVRVGYSLSAGLHDSKICFCQLLPIFYPFIDLSLFLTS